MGSAIQAGTGMLLGGLGGAAQNQMEGGKTAGNMYASPGTQAGAMNNVNQGMTTLNGLIGATPTTAQAENSVQNSGIFGQLYGKGGTLQNTVGEENKLANQGYSLQPEDHEAYGQASGNIARMFGTQEQGLAQSLSNRGLSNSGVAGQQFSGMYGNKQEQLGQLQTQIAQNRMKMNMDRLGQTRNFLNQMSGNAQNAVQGQFGREMDSYNAQGNMAKDSINASMGYLGKAQQQQNENLTQEQQTQHGGSFGNILTGVTAGMGAGAPKKGATSGGGTGALS